MDSNKAAVADFLRNVKSILTNGTAQDNRFIFVTSREENNNALIQLGITPKDVPNIILSLTPSDCISGPGKDDDPGIKGVVCAFLKDVEGTEEYIKISLVGDDSYRDIRCISFHPPR